MIKNIRFIFLLLVANSPILHGQVLYPLARDMRHLSVVDSGKITVSYAFNAADINDYKTYDDLQLLEIGTALSKYYSFFVSNSDFLVTEWNRKNPNANSIPGRLGIQGKDIFWSEYYWSEYYKDLTRNTFTEYARMPNRLEKTNAYYVEEIPSLEWEIAADTLTIATYLCQKALCYFRGRDYVAWFAPDIPINNGPWKFGGLPGLILKVSDTSKRCDFECIKIEQSKQNFPIKKHPEYESDYKRRDRKELLKYQKEIHENYHKLAGFGPPGDFVNGKFVPNGRSRPKITYDPIELE